MHALSLYFLSNLSLSGLKIIGTSLPLLASNKDDLKIEIKFKVK